MIFLLFPVHAYACSWSHGDTVRQSVFTTLALVDWLQTQEIVKNDLYDERNRFIGSQPSMHRVNTYFAVTTIGNYLIAKHLPCRARRLWQYVFIGERIGVVNHNINIGIRINY